MINTTWIKKVYTENIGGGCMVDTVELKDGTVITITDDSVIVYADITAYQADIEGYSDSALGVVHLKS